MDYVAQDPDFEARVRAGFARQSIMDTLGARMTRVEPGRVEITVDFGPTSRSSTATFTPA